MRSAGGFCSPTSFHAVLGTVSVVCFYKWRGLVTTGTAPRKIMPWHGSSLTNGTEFVFLGILPVTQTRANKHVHGSVLTFLQELCILVDSRAGAHRIL